MLDAAAETSTACAAVDTAALPPAKKFAPPPICVLTADVGKPPAALYWTVVRSPVTVQPGGGMPPLESTPPGPSSAPGLVSRLVPAPDAPIGTRLTASSASAHTTSAAPRPRNR